MSEDLSITNSAATPLANVARLQIDSKLKYELDTVCDFVFQIHASIAPDQAVLQETLTIEPFTPCRTYTEFSSGNRFLRLQAQPGTLSIDYRALIERRFEAPDLAAPEVPVNEIPDDVMHFLLPTRFCELDKLAPAALELFGALPRGYSRVQAIADWVHANIEYSIGTTIATTTASDVFAQRQGVCRDFAHLAVTFCRALNIPARLVCGYTWFADPPPDFHAIFEAYLGGRWVLFDPSRMAPVEHVVRVATGPDAKDVAFATIFGPARMVAMSPDVTLLGPVAGGRVEAGAVRLQRQTEPAL